MVDDPDPDDSVRVALVVPLVAVSASACIVPTRAKTPAAAASVTAAAAAAVRRAPLRTASAAPRSLPSWLLLRMTLCHVLRSGSSLREVGEVAVRLGRVSERLVLQLQTSSSLATGPVLLTSAARRAIASSTVSSSRSPVRRSFSLRTPSAERRPATRIFGTPMSSASVNFTPWGDPGAVVHEDAYARRAELLRHVEGQLGLQGLAGGDDVDVGGSDLLGPAQPLLVGRLLGERRDRAGDTDAVRAHGHANRLALLAEDVELEGVGVLAAELEDVADLDGAVQLEAGAALGARVALFHHDDVQVVVDFEVAAGDDVLRVRVDLVGAGDPGGAGGHPRVGDVAELLQALRADVAADEVAAALEVLGGDEFDDGGGEALAQLAEVDLAVAGTLTATISPSTLTRRFLRVAEAGTPRCSASVSMVGVSGVSSSSTGPTPEPSTGFRAKVTASVLAA